MIDYEGIIEDLKDEDVFHLLEELGAEPIDKEAYIICKTICHNEDTEDASQKLYYYKNSHMFYCYTNCGSMSIFKLLKSYYEARQYTYDWYNDIFQVVLNCSAYKAAGTSRAAYKSQRDNYAPKKVRKDLPTYPEGILDVFVKHYPVEWLNDSISKEAMDKYNIKFSISQNKIIIPHYDVNGGLVGIRGRALNPQEVENVGKYAPVWIEGKCYSHPLSLNLYGLNMNKENIKKSGVCFLSEGEKSCLQAEGFSFPNCAVAVCGSKVNKFQIDLLIRYCQPKEVVICFDQEELPNRQDYFNNLYTLCKKYNSYVNMSFIYDRDKLLKLKDSPFDNGEEIFMRLLNGRVKI